MNEKSKTQAPRMLTSDVGRAIAYARVENLTPDASNPRKHTREQTLAIAKSIEAFGFNAPILVGKEDRIVAGHGRLEAAKYLGLDEVPIIRLEHLSASQAKAYMLADNKLTDRSSWEEQKLAVVLKELSDIALNFEIEATGFELPEIDLMIQSLDPPEACDAADDFEQKAGPAVSRPGDLWALGGHRLFCGDALEPQAYEILLDGAKAAAVLTDPPYNVPVNGHVSGKGANKHREFQMASGEMSESEFRGFLENVFRHVVAHAVEEATFFAFMDWRHMTDIETAIKAVGCDVLNLCVWVKTNGGMGSLYRSRHELVFVFGRRGAKRVNNVQLGRHGRNRTNVWTYPGMNSFARRGKTRALDYHPTVKPISLVADALQDVTHRDDIVLDPFCGSGTTILAAERTSRCCYGLEIEPLYIDTTINRWEKLTGKAAVLPSGMTFEEAKKERETLV